MDVLCGNNLAFLEIRSVFLGYIHSVTKIFGYEFEVDQLAQIAVDTSLSLCGSE